ncbi:MAG: tetratricopeptide repeat protein [Pirellulales bacterium]
MRRLVLCGTLILLVLAARHASAQSFGARASAPAASFDRHHHHHDHHHHHGGRSGWWFDLSFPWIGSGGFAPECQPYYPSFTYFGYSIVLPPVAAPMAFNPAPAGVAPAAGVGLLANNPAAIDKPAAGPAPPPKLKATHAEQKARAGQFIGFGDANFAKQKYLSAAERYKKAIEIAPDVAESYFRQAFALAAMGRYEKAAQVFRRGLGIRSDWTGSPFRLDQLYADAALAKTHHIESLAKAVEANPLDADLLLVMGMQLFFDGQGDRAGVFFARAAQLGGNEDRLLNDFLPRPKPDGAASEPKENGKIVF